IPGMIALMAYCGLYWGVCAMVWRGAGLTRLWDDKTPGGAGGYRKGIQIAGAALLIAAIWVAGEWIRGSLMTGLPWLYLGHTQSRALAMCQIADITGVYGVTFVVVVFNVMVATFLLARRHVLPVLVLTIVLLAGNLAYGIRELMHPPPTHLGPVVMVIQ